MIEKSCPQFSPQYDQVYKLVPLQCIANALAIAVTQILLRMRYTSTLHCSCLLAPRENPRLVIMKIGCMKL